MKKVFFTLILAASAMNINAQFVVDTLGQVGIGTETPKSLLSIGSNGSGDNAITCDFSGKKNGIHIVSPTNNDTDLITGYYSFVRNYLGNCNGGQYITFGNNDDDSSQQAIGLIGQAAYAHTAIGLFGCTSPSGTLVNFAGVYGSQTGNTPTFTNYSGKYAGFFRGRVRVTNGIYATVLSPTTSTSPSGQNGTTILSDRDESVTDKLSQVQAVQFLRYDPTQEANTLRASIENIDTDNMTPEELDSLAEAMGDIEPEHYLSPVQYGLDAAQLKEVYPELVYEDANGNVSINYVEMVPLLVQCINELSAKVAELEGTSPRGAKAPTNATDIEKSVADVDMVRMDQNKPNPFSESTVIALNIPRETQSASIFIYDMSGKQVQSLPVSERGKTNITVYASDLAAGMYIYTLIVDGNVAVTRRMIVSKN